MYGESFRLAFGMVCIYIAFGIVRMGNWTHNDTFRAAGDATYGTVLEIVFMYLMVIPVVCVAGLKFRVSIYVLFPLVYCDEIIRFVIMLIHLHSGRWVRPVTEHGKAVLPEFREKHSRRH